MGRLRRVFSRRFWLGAGIVAFLAAVGGGKWQLNQIHAKWAVQDEQDARKYEGDMSSKRYRYRYGMTGMSRAEVSTKLGAPIRENLAIPIGPGGSRQCICNPPNTSLTLYLRFDGDQLVGADATYEPWKHTRPWWWEPAEITRHWASLAAAMAWIICFAGAAAELSLRPRLGAWAVFLGLLCAMLWLGEPGVDHRIYNLHVPGGVWIGLGMAALSAIVLFRRPRVAREPLCPHCGYNLTGNESGICPECGQVTPAEQRRRHDAAVSHLASSLSGDPEQVA